MSKKRENKDKKKNSILKIGGPKCETKFFIESVKKDLSGDVVVEEYEFFAGFVNEVSNIGTEDEGQCWENEKWVDSTEDALGFDSYCEAKAWYDNICGSCMDCYIVLYGKSKIRGMDGSRWFPLKNFDI